MRMLFAPAELYPYDWWAMKSITFWRMAWEQSEECRHLQWIGEMEMFRYEGGMKHYNRLKELMKGYATEEMLKGQAFGL